MSVFPILKRRFKSAEWAKLLQASPKSEASLLERYMQMELDDDYRIITESAELVIKSRNPETRSGRMELMQKHLNHMLPLEPFADDVQREMIKDALHSATLAKNSLQKVNGGPSDTDRYLVYTVLVHSKNREFYYLGRCANYAPGDAVAVPFGTDDDETQGTIVASQYYTKQDAPYPLSGMKYILRKCGNV